MDHCPTAPTLYQPSPLPLPQPTKALLLTTAFTKAAQAVPVPSNTSVYVWGGTVSDAGGSHAWRDSLQRVFSFLEDAVELAFEKQGGLIPAVIQDHR